VNPERGCHGKRVFWDGIAAARAIDFIQGRGGPRMRHYKCPYCYQHHLTRLGVDQETEQQKRARLVKEEKQRALEERLAAEKERAIHRKALKRLKQEKHGDRLQEQAKQHRAKVQKMHEHAQRMNEEAQKAKKALRVALLRLEELGFTNPIPGIPACFYKPGFLYSKKPETKETPQ
jgi:hypothetical protein